MSVRYSHPATRFRESGQLCTLMQVIKRYEEKSDEQKKTREIGNKENMKNKIKKGEAETKLMIIKE